MEAIFWSERRITVFSLATAHYWPLSLHLDIDKQRTRASIVCEHQVEKEVKLKLQHCSRCFHQSFL